MSKARPDTQYLAATAETARAVETVEVVAPRHTVDRWIARLPVMKLRLYLDYKIKITNRKPNDYFSTA